MNQHEKLLSMLLNQLTRLNREAGRLTRLASASTYDRERRWLRAEAKSTRNKAKLVRSRYEKILGYMTQPAEVINLTP